MTPEKIVFIIALILVITSLATTLFFKLPKKLKHDSFVEKWRALQSRCASKDQWKQAIIEADDLLALALKKKKIKGATTGEKLVAAQKLFTDHDGVWFGHKLRTKIDSSGDEIVLKKEEVKKALMGIGQGLRDIGALK